MRIEIINNKHRKVGLWRRDIPDHRDFIAKRMVKKLPKQASVRDKCPVVEDQGDLGSCTANSSTSGCEFLFGLGLKDLELSRLYNYWMTRVMVEHSAPTDDSGAQIRDVVKSLHKYGVCPESVWPYDVSKLSVEPSDEAKAQAKQYAIQAYHRCPTLLSIKDKIAGGLPVVGGFSVPENMMSEECAKNGVVHYPGATEQIVGGHAVLFTGYDDGKKLLQFQNSWGSGWGDSGFGYLPYQFVTDKLADDFWVITKL